MTTKQAPRSGSPIVWTAPDGYTTVELGVTDNGLFTVWERVGGHGADGEAPIPFATYAEAAALATMKVQIILSMQSGR